ncbi:MAG: transglycosylase SLT domain-containing protein [Hyphomicrobiales bacterium]|nr:transglycosylase SLT domain-containing protein [Hyphomicrobiales bacterium]
MKILTVFAAAVAAGLTIFAANAQEASQQVSMLSAWPDADRSPARPVLNGTDADARNAERGLTAEEAFHAAQTADNAEDRYKPIVERYASENGVSVELAHAVITVESNYRVYSLGKAGEVGLMQIKPATAAMMGYAGSTTGLFDPETNIKYGMKYLGKAQRLGDGTTCGTILKYNAGHSAKHMNPTSKDYCAKVKRYLAASRTVLLDLVSEREFDRGV